MSLTVRQVRRAVVAMDKARDALKPFATTSQVLNLRADNLIDDLARYCECLESWISYQRRYRPRSRGCETILNDPIRWCAMEKPKPPPKQ